MIEKYIGQRFPYENPQCAAYRQWLVRLCNDFIDRGLADPTFIGELTSGQDSKFWSRLSEALLADQLRCKDFPERPNAGEGPDFLVTDGARNIWIEVICPEPRGLPENWLNFQEGVTDFPHEAILLRWTAAIKEKAEKLIGSADGRITGYLQTGVVAPEDPYIIAVNGCQLRNGTFSALFGISQSPFAVEAVFPVGPYQLRIDRETGKVVGQGHQHRPYVMNRNGAMVPAYTFLDDRFNNISAIWAVDLNGASAIGNNEPKVIVHNPNATNPIPTGFLPADSEYIATPNGTGELTLERVG